MQNVIQRNNTQAMIPMPCSQAARRRPASQRAGWTIYKKHIFETVTFPLQFPFVKWLPRPLSDQNDKKMKNQEFKKTHEFLEILDFSLFLSFWSESGLGSHFTKGNCKGNVIVSKMDLLAMVQPVASRPAGWPASLNPKYHQQPARS